MHNTAAFYCATYRRPDLLSEAIACFLAQEWDGNKLLVIVNDEPEQELIFDHPEVHIFNLDNRMSLSAKWNLAVEQCSSADMLFHMDDDDLFSPARIDTAFSGMRGGVFKTDEFVIDTTPPQNVLGRNLGNYAFSPSVFFRYGLRYFSLPRRPHSDINLMDQIDFYMDYNNIRCKRTVPFFFYRKHHGAMNYSRVRGRSDSSVSNHGGWFERGPIHLEPKIDFDFNVLAERRKPKKIHTVDKAYSAGDLTMFYNGMEEENGC